MKSITHSQFMDMMCEQGVEREHMAVVCPMCGTVQSITSLIRAGAGADFETVNQIIGFSCVGRWRTPRLSPTEARAAGEPCNWTLGGLLQTHTMEITTEDGKVFPCFEPATPEQAQQLAAQWEAAP